MGHLGAKMLEVARAAARHERARRSRRRSSRPTECTDKLHRGARYSPRRRMEQHLHVRCGNSAKVLEEQRGWVAGTGRSSRTLTSGSLLGIGIAPASRVAGWLARRRAAHWLAVPAGPLSALLGAHIRPEHVCMSRRTLF